MKQKNGRVFFFVVLFGVLFVGYPNIVTNTVKEAPFLCFDVVIPSLFPFFVLSSFAVNTGFLKAAGNFISPVAELLFSVSGSGAAAFVTGLLCGSPTGAKTVAELYQKGMIEKEEAERLLGFCNNVSPVFVIGAVGNLMQDTRIGKALFIVHVIAGVFTGMILSIGHRKHRQEEKMTVFSVGFGEALTDAVKKSVKTMLDVCGFVVLFSVVISFMKLFFQKIAVAPLFAEILGGILEMTVGAKEISLSNVAFYVKMVLLSFVLGFGGLCVFFQGCSSLIGTGLSARTYFYGKLLHAGISVLLMMLFFAFQNKRNLLFHDVGTIGIFLGIFLLFFVAVLIVDKRGKNTYNKENRG